MPREESASPGRATTTPSSFSAPPALAPRILRISPASSDRIESRSRFGPTSVSRKWDSSAARSLAAAMIDSGVT